VSKETAIEIIALAAGWVFAAMIQFLLNYSIAYFISQHWITDSFIASQGPGWEWFYNSLRDELNIGMLIGLLIGFGIYRLAKNRIELECALYASFIIAVFLGVFIFVTRKGIDAWGNLIFFVECAPLSAVLWKGFYVWGEWVNKRNNVEVDKAEALQVNQKVVQPDPKPTATAKVAIDETKELNKEDKPAEEVPQPSKKPTIEETLKSPWRLE